MPKRECPTDCELEPPGDEELTDPVVMVYYVKSDPDRCVYMDVLARCECGNPYVQVKMPDDSHALVRYDKVGRYVKQLEYLEWSNARDIGWYEAMKYDSESFAG